MAFRGELIDGKYEVLMEIGKGGMSTVYLAIDKRLNKQWAIKEIKKIANNTKSEIDVHSILTEANLMKRLDHPSLPRIVDIINLPDTIYVIMDYIEGQSLKDVLLNSGAQPQESVIDWAKQLCEALRYLHNQTPPIIYRDMKPANVMLKPEGALKLIDFGIAREYKEFNTDDTINLGTPGYAAPEQRSSSSQTDQRTDIYCLGATLYHLVTGHNPSEAPYVMYPIRTWNPMLSSGLEHIISKCTEQDPRNRYQNCDELMYALEHYNEVDDEYKKKERKKLVLFSISAGLTIILLSLGILFSVLKTKTNNMDYEQKINISSSTQYNVKVATYKEAIELYPYRMEAYIKLLEAYSDNNQFGEEESKEFMSYYNNSFNEANKGKYNYNSEDFARLNFELAISYLYLYDSNNDSYSLKVNALKAQPFFAKIIDNTEFEKTYVNYDLAKSYNILCTFYKDYVANAKNTKEPSQNSYVELLNSLQICVNNLDGYDYDDIAYIKLTIYESVLDLIQSQRKGLAFTETDMDKVLKLMELIYDKTEDIAVTQERSLNKQSRILDNYELYESNIYIAYGMNKEKE